MKIKKYSILIIAALCLLLTGCGHVKSAKKLFKQAKREHGKCEVVSKSETKEKTVVRLRDDLQGFEYEIVSAMHGIVIDGSSFGSLPSTTDSFEMSLHSYVTDQLKPKLDKLCTKYNATYEDGYDKELIKFILTSPNKDANAVPLVEAAAKLYQEYNVENRLDKCYVSVEHDNKWFKEKYPYPTDPETLYSEDSYLYSSAGSSIAKHIGSANLPDCTFRDKEAETDDYYLEMAKMKNPDAVFVRKEKKTFADSGANLHDVMHTIGEKSPEKTTDPVTFYYYSVNGKEFYLCDFLVQDTGTWYTNYNEVFLKK
ncbi:MAG: hypothetical protein E7271_02500 [Lachnospiraceae bacterium]|nr:hypothetical protein [Lachnospiraceae bacterium]